MKNIIIILSLLITSNCCATEIDYMEYANDAAAQAAYVTNGIADEAVDQQNTTAVSTSLKLGASADPYQYRIAQSFILTGTKIVTAVEVKNGTTANGSPSGNWTLRIETDNSGAPSGTLADANASIVVTPPAINTIIKGTFATPFLLSPSTTYWLKIDCSNQSTNVYWNFNYDQDSGYADGVAKYSGDGTWFSLSTWDIYFKIYTKTVNLQSYSSSAIKTQGSYSLKGVATDGAVNKTLTRTIGSPIDLTGSNTLKFDIRSSRTGSNLKVGLRNDGTEIATESTETGIPGVLGRYLSSTYTKVLAQSFQLSSNSTVTDIEVNCSLKEGSPTGNWTVRIETNNSGVPSGTLADANATKTITPPSGAAIVKATFDTPFSLSATTTYWIVVLCDSQDEAGKYWFLEGVGNGNYDSAYSFDGGSFWTSNTYTYWFKVYIQNYVTTELTPSISSANTWETKTWDISSVADADKNAIDQIIVTVVNADAANTFYMDNFNVKEAQESGAVFSIAGD